MSFDKNHLLVALAAAAAWHLALAAPKPASIDHADDSTATRFQLTTAGLAMTSTAASPLAPIVIAADSSSRKGLCALRPALVGPSGAVDARVVCDRVSGTLRLQPTHDLLPAASYALIVRGTSSSVLPISFTTLSLPAEVMPAAAASSMGAEWIPPTTGRWRYTADGAAQSADDAVDLQAPAGRTALAGHLERMDGSPIAGATVAIDDRRALSDAQGRFLLSELQAGSHVLKVDGTQVQADGGHFTKHFLHVDVQAGHTSQLPQPVYLARVDPATEVAIASPTDHEIVLTHPAMQGLEVRIPKGVVLREFDGSLVRKLSLTPVPVDRAPYAVPTDFSIYFTLQPGGAFVDGGDQAVQVVYPNYGHLMARTAIDLWNYDPQAGWKVYGHGHISDDGATVVADGGTFGLKQVMTFGFGISTPPPNWIAPVPGGARSGDPVDLATGMFTYRRTDLAINDVLPIGISRTYLPSDPNVRPFGVGMNFSYNMALYQPNASEIDLELADGTLVPFKQQAAGVFVCASVPGAWQQATLAQYVNPNYTHKNQYKVTMHDGSSMLFDGDPPNPLLELRDANGNAIKFTYTNHQISRVTSPNGRTIDLTYTGNLITQIKDNAGRTVVYQYDAAGTRLTKVFDADQTILPLAQQVPMAYGYDANGRLYTVTDKRGKTLLTNQYYPDGRIQTQTLGDGTSWGYTYSPTFPGTSIVQGAQVTNPRGYVTQYTFNNYGYATKVIAAQNATQPYAPRTYTFTRDPVTNNATSVGMPLARHTSFAYDAQGNVRSAQIFDQFGTFLGAAATYSWDPQTGGLLSVTNAVGATTHFGRDSAGNLTSVTDALGRVSQINRNGYGLPQQFVDPLGHTLAIGYSGADATDFTDDYGRHSSVTYDALGRVDSATDAIGNTTHYQFDPTDRLQTLTDALGNSTSIQRYSNGATKTLQRAGHSAGMTYSYDDAGRANSGADELGRGWSAQMDGNGNVTQFMDELKHKTTATFTPFDEIDTITYDDATTLKFSYDNAGRLQTAADSKYGTVSIALDNLDHVTRVQTPYGKVGYTPDAIGRITWITYPSGLQVHQGYDSANQLKTLTVGGDQPFTAVYEDNGRLKTLTLPNGAVRTQTYVAPGDDLAGIAYADSAGNAIGNWAYTHDGLGRIQNISGTLFTPVMPAAFSGTYDDAEQLTNEGSTAVSSQADGSQTSDLNLTFSYDARGRMTGAAKAGNPSATYGYNALGQRDTKTLSDGTVTHYFYDLAGHLIAETDGAGNTQFEYVWFGDMPVMMRAYAGGVATEHLLLTDHQGTPRRVIDFGNRLRWSWDSEPYGSGTSNNNPSGFGAVQMHLRFAGQVYDNETGLHYNGARYYNPKTGRYVQRDPLGLSGGALNFYTYAGGDPINSVDPSGLAFDSVTETCLHSPAFCAETVGPEWAQWAKAGGYAGSAAAAAAAANYATSPGSTGGGEQMCPVDMLGGLGALGNAVAASVPDGAPAGDSEAAAGANDAGASGEATTTPPPAPLPDLPANPDDLPDQGYNETSHPDAAAHGHRTFENPETGDKVRFDKGKPGAPGHEGRDHYHRYNPQSTGKGDQYLDRNGNPTPRGSDASHLYGN